MMQIRRSVQRVLANNAWSNRLNHEDRLGLKPAFLGHVNPYGKFRLDMDRHLDVGLPAVA